MSRGCVSHSFFSQLEKTRLLRIFIKIQFFLLFRGDDSWEFLTRNFFFCLLVDNEKRRKFKNTKTHTQKYEKHVEGRKCKIRMNEKKYKLTIIDLYGYNFVRNFCGWISFMLYEKQQQKNYKTHLYSLSFSLCLKKRYKKNIQKIKKV
jgi:hypothetical protein